MTTGLLDPKRPDAVEQALTLVRDRMAGRSLLVWFASGAVMAVLWVYFVRHEWPWINIAFTLGVTVTLISGVLLASRRILFSTALVAGGVALVIAASEVKRHYLGMSLHAYDIVFYILSPDTLSFLWTDFRLELCALVGSVVAVLMLGWVLYRFDPTRVPFRLACALCMLSIATAAWAAAYRGGRHHTLYYWGHHYVSSFYLSWAETVETLLRGQLIEAAPHSNGGPVLAAPTTCRPSERPPNIILIHQESVFPPSYFAGIRYDARLDPFFRSSDGQLHKLRVETYGGASWLTEFSVLAGVSTLSFGGMRPFVQSLMQGKVHDTVPETLARCGYRNTLYYPMNKDFVSSAKFYQAIGFGEILDRKAQGATRYNERDRFYYDNALANMERHFKGSQAPIFNFIITAATHLPYEPTFMPEIDVPGGGPTPEMHEYLRRVGLAKRDYDYFRVQLARRFPNERFLIVQYGDHQPVVTRPYLGFDQATATEDMTMGPDSPGYLTYYTVEGVNYDPGPLPDVDVLDVPYLGALLLNAAKIPISDAQHERLRLLSVCKGRYFTCLKRDEILSFHRRLIDSGLMLAR
ncbi:sulfatase-like hydrolase/transferase [Hyphomicrobium sp.]|uniref:sulfatase-like hydrolase/transferase n=1 Tax=Hyphomicrobium sp. TaxID=82 RepID=UPI002E30493B|nr:sulfatase-like hydrolase/transferase [Hyphomicrobium sp.]HEX2841842.1 sulfatase-like hydrolase/transferase [Hyphomicrobium sp.]